MHRQTNQKQNKNQITMQDKNWWLGQIKKVFPDVKEVKYEAKKKDDNLTVITWL